VQTQKQKKKEDEEKGFDLLEASFLEKGLVAAGTSRSMGLRAVGEAHSHQEKHHSEKERKHETEFKATTAKNHNRAVKTKMAKLAGLIPVKLRPKYGYMPRQLKKPDVDKPGNEKKA
jgi:hypothetical protein